MTQREREIYEIIRAMPMIEQSEIAQKLSITRSSVAVHIANLQKKGHILGRGYLLREQDYIIGIGAANVDIHGKSKKSIILKDSNPGNMYSSAGGVTRNVAENLARLGAPVKLISALGDDIYAEQIKSECAAAGIDFSHSMVVEKHPSSTYISILDENGDMYVAMSDMSVLQRMNMEYLKSKAGIISGAKYITLDAGLPEEVLEGVLDAYGKQTPVFIDPVSCTYAEKLKPIIGRIDTIKPNKLETEVISGMKIETEVDLERAADSLLEKGLKHIYISLGMGGCFYMNREGAKLKRALKPLEQMENATGGGDAFMAAVLYARLLEFNMTETMDFALAAGVAAISCKSTINPDISTALIEKILEERKR